MAMIEQHSCAGNLSAKRARVSFSNWLALWRSRHALARLDTRALEDIGLHPDEALREAQRPLWDVPANWIQR